MNLLWIIFFVNSILLDGKFTSGKAEPDITLLSRVTKDDKINITCAAGPNINGSALTFITPLGGYYENLLKQVSIYTSNEGVVYPSDAYDCDFESRCKDGWVKSNEQVSYAATEGLHDLAPVTDERWENFPTYFSNQKNTKLHDFEKVIHSVGLSVRTDGEAWVSFCFSTTTTWYTYNHCYWIILNDKIYKGMMTLWYCTKKDVTDPREDSYYCKILSSAPGQGISLTETSWTHFNLMLLEKKITVKVENLNFITLPYDTQSPVSQVKQISLGNTEKAIWKVHDYNYLSLLNKSNIDPNSWLPVGPALQADDTGCVCVEFYAATCPTCTLRFRFDHSSEIKEKSGNSTQSRQHWKLIRLEMRTTPGKEYRLQVQASGTGGYWLMDNVRRCHEHETRTVSLTVPMNEKDIISCQSLKQPDMSSSIIGGQVNNKNLDVCNNDMYTGSACGVSCLSALGTDCSNVIVCEPSRSRKNPRCSCASGYTGAKCQDMSPVFDSLNVTWVNDKARVTWDPSSIFSASNVGISFVISIKLINTLLDSNPYFHKNYTIPKQDDSQYTFELPDDVPLSSTYRVQVQARTVRGVLTYSTSVNVSSPAVTPRFMGEVTRGSRTNTTQDIVIPSAHPDTLTTKSFFFVLICNLTSTSDFITEETVHSKLHSWSNCTGTSWIAVNLLTATNTTMNFTVGNSTNNTNNKPLTPDSYMINVIFWNEYNGDEKYVISTTGTETLGSGTETLGPGAEFLGSNPALYALLLLLLIPAIVLFVIWKMRSSKKSTEMSVTYHAVSTGPNVQFTNNSTQNTFSVNNENNASLILKNKHNTLQNKIASNIVPNSNVEDEQQLYSKVVDINNFLNYVKESLENSELNRQFELLPKGEQKPNKIGTSKENASKNRYKNLTAYDHSRVILEKIRGDDFSDFINANYIDGYKQKKAYIATQGPRKSTVNDFWRMIWQKKVECIVMMTNLIEEGKVKCEKYWPDRDEPLSYGLISVTLLEVDTYADFEYRIFNVQKNGACRKVQQYHFTSWPDHGVPLYPQSLVPFLDKLSTISPAQAPIVVHCSAGVGRTGTIILSDICLRMAAAENKIDVLKYYYIMREQRCNMVAEYDQYELAHMVLLEYLFASQNSIPCIEIGKTVDKLIKSRKTEEQMKYLKDTAWQNQGRSGVAEINEDITNKSKNRFLDIVPNRRRIYLFKGMNESDYINAVPVDGYRNKGQFLVTQNPLPTTVKDFWRMVCEFQVEVIVSLNEMKKNDEFWPQENKEMSVSSHWIVKFQSMINESVYFKYNFQLINTRNSGDDEIRSVSILQFKNWRFKDITPLEEKQIIDFVELTTRQVSPIVVTCFDGARASGLYCALSFVLEKIKLEQVCDVCLAVRTVRNNREQFVNDIKQFEFLYKAAVRYVSTFELYSNFEK